MKFLLSQRSGSVLLLAAPGSSRPAADTAFEGLPPVLELRQPSDLAALEAVMADRAWTMILCIREAFGLAPDVVLGAAERAVPTVPVLFVADWAALNALLAPQHHMTEERVAATRGTPETAAQESEDWTRLAFSASELGRWRHDLIADRIALDARAKTHYGIDEDAVPISRVLQIVHPDDVQRLGGEVATALAPTSDGRYKTEYRVIHPDGSVHWLAVQVQVYFQGEGETRIPLFGFGTSQEITQRKAGEMALRQSEEWLRLAFYATSLGKWRHDLRDDSVLFDETAQQHFDIDQAQIPLSRVVERVHPDDRAFLQREITKVLDPALGGRNTTEYRVIRADGSVHWLSVHVQAYYNGDGNTSTPVYLFGSSQDITQQKAAEAALRQSEARLALFIAHAPAAIAMLDRDMRYLAVSDRWLSDYHLNEVNIIGRSHYDIFPDLPEGWKAVHQRCLAGAVEKADADPFLRYDGSLDWVRWEIRPWHDPTGAVGGILLFSEVITAQKQAEDALREAYEHLEQRVLERTAELRASEARYRLLAENVSDVIVKMLPDGTRTYVTPSVFNLFGYKPEELIGRRAWELVHPEDLPNTSALFQQAVQRGLSQFQVTQRVRHKDGHYVWVEMTNSIIRDVASAQPIELIGVVHDISERKRSELELISLSQRLQLATEIGAIGIWDWDLPSDRLIWDEQMYRLYGLQNERNAMTAADLWSRQLLIEEDHPRMRQEVAEAMGGRRPLDTEFRIQHQDGNLRYIKAKAVALREGAQEPTRMVGVNWDITVLREAEENLRWALQKEQELGALKSRFVSMASHEFRTPLTSILTTTETLMRHRGRMTDAQIDERLERIREQVDYMRGIMEDVLQMSRIQAGRVEFKPVEGDLKAFCQDIIREFAAQPDHEGRLIEALPDAPIALTFDRRLMRQVMSNLISNALKYSDREKPVRVNLAQSGERVTLRVSDQGIGIPPDDLAHLFEPFHRATNAATISGTGLGLSIARQAVEMHGGTIGVETEVDVGTTFTVQFPNSARVG